MLRSNRQARVTQLTVNAVMDGLKWLIHRSQANAALRDAWLDTQLDAQVFPPEYLDWVIQSRWEEWQRLNAQATTDARQAWSSVFALAIEKSCR
jgi:hypothetical protein